MKYSRSTHRKNPERSVKKIAVNVMGYVFVSNALLLVLLWSPAGFGSLSWLGLFALKEKVRR